MEENSVFMDIEIPQKERNHQSRLRYLKIGSLILLVVAVIVGFRYLIKPTADYRSLQTSTVVKGTIQASLTANGRIVPEYEQIMTSPLQARIDSVYHRAGSVVKAGSPILKLDLSYTQLELEKLEESLQKKRNEATLIRLRMEKSLADLKSQSDIKQLQISSLQSELENERHLVSVGGGTPESVRQAELNLQIAGRELQQLQEQISNQQQTNIADLNTLGYEIRIEEKGINELRRRMQQAEIRAERDGVIVYVKDKLGAQVQAGEEVVRLADLSRFKVAASISEAYAGELSPGGKVIVRSGSTDLTGMISSIKPEITNGQINFEVSLENSDAPMLRPNLQVDVFVVTAFKDDVLMVKNGAFFKGRKDQKVFVVQGERAYARSVDIGLSNLDSVEITGLTEGEELIISDMSKFEQAEEVQLTNR